MPIGVVDSIVGVRRSRLIFTGQADHAGTTPMERRRDAFLAAADYALHARDLVVERGGGRSVTNIGVVYVHPGRQQHRPRPRRARARDARAPTRELLERLAQASARPSPSEIGQRARHRRRDPPDLGDDAGGVLAARAGGGRGGVQAARPRLHHAVLRGRPRRPEPGPRSPTPGCCSSPRAAARAIASTRRATPRPSSAAPTSCCARSSTSPRSRRTAPAGHGVADTDPARPRLRTASRRATVDVVHRRPSSRGSVCARTARPRGGRARGGCAFDGPMSTLVAALRPQPLDPRPSTRSSRGSCVVIARRRVGARWRSSCCASALDRARRRCPARSAATPRSSWRGRSRRRSSCSSSPSRPSR